MNARDSRSTPLNIPCMSCEPPCVNFKVILGNISLTLNDLEWSIFSWVRFPGSLKSFNLIWGHFTHYGPLHSSPKIATNVLFGLGFLSLRAICSFFFLLRSSNFIRDRTVGGPADPCPLFPTCTTLWTVEYGRGIRNLPTNFIKNYKGLGHNSFSVMLPEWGMGIQDDRARLLYYTTLNTTTLLV